MTNVKELGIANGRVIESPMSDSFFGDSGDWGVFPLLLIEKELRRTWSVKAHNARVEKVMRIFLNQGFLLSNDLSNDEINKLLHASGRHDAGKQEIDPDDYYSGQLSDDRKKEIFGPHSYLGSLKFEDPWVSGVILYHHPVGPEYASKEYQENAIYTPHSSKLVRIGVEWLVVVDRMVSLLIEHRPYTPNKGNISIEEMMNVIFNDYEEYQKRNVPIDGEYVRLEKFADMVAQIARI